MPSLPGGALATAPNASIPLGFRKRTSPVGDEKFSAAGVLFVTPEGDGLFMRRTDKGDHGGEWSIPAGRVEQDEEPADAARRECVEELGSLPVWQLDGLHRATSDEGVDFATFGAEVPERFDPKLNHEHDDYVWAPLNDPPQPLHPGMAGALKQFFAEEAEEPEHKGSGAAAKLAGDWNETDRFSMRQRMIDRREAAARTSDPNERLRLERQADYLDDLLRGETEERLRALEGDEAADSVGPSIDREHDGPWMSRMSKDGSTLYVNKEVPPMVNLNSGPVDVDLVLLERAKGGQAEHEYCQEHGIDWDAWQKLSNGIEVMVKKGPFTNPPQDDLVQDETSDQMGGGAVEAYEDGIPQWGELEGINYGAPDGFGATDSALRLPLALDKDSVRKLDKDGRMRVSVANISKANVCPYRGNEIPGWQELGLDPEKIYKMFRHPDELKKSVPTWNGIQLLSKHVPVDADDHRKHDIVGTTGTNASFEDPYLRNSLVIWTKEGIDLVESDKQRELSCGYHYTPDLTPGEYQGEKYDGVMRDISGNHVALVEEGRAGPDVMVGDTLSGLQWDRIAGALEVDGWA